jgi:hypothetical protein
MNFRFHISDLKSSPHGRLRSGRERDARSLFSERRLGSAHVAFLGVCLVAALLLIMNLNISIEENVSERIGNLAQLGIDRRDLNDVLGRQMANDLREHFRMRNVNGPRNQFGAPSSGFWSEIRDSVSDQETDNDGSTVTISDPRFNQKYYGGEIHMDDKLLAIPARTEAYNKSPRLFSNLKAVFFHSGAIALVSFDPEAKREKGEKRVGAKTPGLIFYWLKESVKQAADANALPLPDVMVSRLLEAADRYVDRILKKRA